MPGAGDIRAGRAFVELGVDDELDSGLNRASAKLKAFGAGIRSAGVQMAALGAAISAPLAAVTYAAARAGEAIYDMSRRTGIGVERLTSLSYAAGQAGTDLDTFEKGIRLMQKSISGIEDATQGTAKGLRHLGIEASQVVGLAPEKQFELIAQRINDIQDPAQRATAALRVFGRTGTALLPMIESLGRLEAEARKYGLTSSEVFIKQTKEFSLTMRLATNVTSSLGEAIASAVMPVILETTERLTQMILRLREWVKLHPQLVANIFRVGVALTITGTAVAALGTAFIGLGSVVGIAATVLGAAASALGVLLSPIGLIVAAVAALGAYFLITSGKGKQAVDALVRAFNVLKGDVAGVFGAIYHAFQGGDLVAAARVGIALLTLEWTRGMVGLRQVFGGLIPYVQWAFGNIGLLAKAGFAIAVAAGSEMADALKNYGTDIWNWFKFGIQVIADRFKWLGQQAKAVFDAMLLNIEEVVSRLLRVASIFVNLGGGPQGQFQALRGLLKLRDQGIPSLHTPNFTAAPGLPAFPTATTGGSPRTAALEAAAKTLADAVAKSFGAVPGFNNSGDAQAIADAQEALAEAIRQANAVPGLQGLTLGADPQRFADGIEDAMGKASSAGTFNPFGAGQFGGTFRNIETNTRRTAVAIERMRREVQDNEGLLFT